MAKECKVRLQSSDDEMFEVDQAVAFQSETIKKMIENVGTESAVPLPNVSSKILVKVIEFCEYHGEVAKTRKEKNAISEDDVENWDREFVREDLFDLIQAAENLKIKNLLDLTCQTAADRLKSGDIFNPPNIMNDFSPEEEKVRREEEKMRHENQWALE